MKQFVKRIPVPIAGLMLGLASLGNLIASYATIYKNIFGTIAALILLLLIIKAAADFKGLLEELKNPVIASVAPTFSMGMIILSTYIRPGIPSVAYLMWILGILIHCLFIIYFTVKFILSFDMKRVFPSYFIVYVGIGAASISAPAFNSVGLGRAIFWFAFITYLILLPVVIYRIFAVRPLQEPVIPTITIFAAPASLCLTGYMNSFEQRSMIIIWLLIVLSLVMYAFVLLYMPRMLKLKFYPSYSSFTFPFVISAIALKATNAFLVKTSHQIAVLKYWGKFEELFAVVIVLYVLIRYINFLFIEKKAKGTIKLSK